MKYLLLVLIALLPGCRKNPNLVSKDECTAAIKKVSAHHLKECVQQVEKALNKVKKAASELNTNCIVVRPKVGNLTVTSFTAGKIRCFCNTTKYRHDDPKCESRQCSSDWTVDLKIENGSARKGDEIHVECVFYDLRNTQQYILREQDFFKASGGKFTLHKFKAMPHDYQLRSVDTSTPIGVNCFVVEHPRPPVNAVTKVTGYTDSTHDR